MRLSKMSSADYRKERKMRIVLGLNDTDIEGLRSLREEQSLYYDSVLEDTEGRELTKTEEERLDKILEQLDVLAKIEGVIDNQMELDKMEMQKTGKSDKNTDLPIGFTSGEIARLKKMANEVT